MAEPISSDILESQFGPTELQILQQDGPDRIISTKTADGRILELSRVAFRPEAITVFPDIHKEIVGGVSMGKAFRAHNVTFTRRVRGSYRSGLPAVFSGLFGSTEPGTVVDVFISVGTENIPYAEVLEIYSPEVAWDSADTEPGRMITDRIQAFGNVLADKA